MSHSILKRMGVKPGPKSQEPADGDLAAQLQAMIDAAVEKRLGNAPTRPGGDRWQRLQQRLGEVHMAAKPVVRMPPVTQEFIPAAKLKMPDQLEFVVVERDWNGRIRTGRFDDATNRVSIGFEVVERDMNGRILRGAFKPMEKWP